MKIALLLPGSGDRFYCENCTRDGSLAAGLIARGHDVTVCPLYLPLDGARSPEGVSAPVFYGAVGVYLRQALPLLRRAPGWVNRAFDSRAALRFAGALSGATDASALGELTVSMLKGEEGNQAAELDDLVEWLAGIEPDVVHISNGLLLGLAGRIRRRLSVPIVCSLQDEDSWVDAMDAPSAAQTWRLMSERSQDVDLFLPVSRFYADKMKLRLGLVDSNMRVVPVGIDPCLSLQSRLSFDPPVIGYLSHMTEDMGLGILFDAFIILKRSPRNRRLKLAVSGGAAGSDHGYVKALQRKLHRAGWGASLSIVPLEKQRQFLSTLTLMSVPVPGGEAFGTFLVEAMASGVPVVQPDLGGFGEVVRSTGGGIVYEPNTADALAAALDRLLQDPSEVARLGEIGRESVRAHFTLDGMIEQIEMAYRRCL
jgi:glycosyltransferase involved in cell wall biosynthesis